MKILHVAAHLGGGVGKAHAAMAPYFSADVEQTFLLMREPIDLRHVNEIKRCGGSVTTRVSECPFNPDVVQFEYWGTDVIWNPPFGVRISEVPVVWVSHRSGIGETKLPDHQMMDHLVLTSSVSQPLIPAYMGGRCSVINSGFGFDAEWRDRGARVCYLGTVDFKKMHPEFFATLDEVDIGAPVSVWGEPSPEVLLAVSDMSYPNRVRLMDHAVRPWLALEQSGIFFYPLRRDHYGTAENALVEAMSLGLVPVVLDNPAEREIVTHGHTGLVAGSVAGAVEEVRALVLQPGLRLELSRNAARAAMRKRPEASAAAFVCLWRRLIEEKRVARAA